MAESEYPAEFDTLVTDADNRMDGVTGEVDGGSRLPTGAGFHAGTLHNLPASAIMAIQQVLGLDPAGGYETVAERLASLLDKAEIEEEFEVLPAGATGWLDLEDVAGANIDGLPSIPSLRSLTTAGLFDAEATDEQTPSRKAVETAVMLLAKVWRSRHTAAGGVSAASTSGKKFWVVNGQSSTQKLAVTVTQPWRIGWVGADEAVSGTITKCKLKAEVFIGATPVKATVHVALYKVVKGEAEITLGEEVAGSGIEIAAGETTKNGVIGESGEFTMPEDGDYSVGATVSGTTEGACSINARHLVHNV